MGRGFYTIMAAQFFSSLADNALLVVAIALLIGRSIASVIHSSLGALVMALTGLAIGWRIRNGVGEAVLAFALLMLFGFGMIWFGILIGSLLAGVLGAAALRWDARRARDADMNRDGIPDSDIDTIG